MNVLFSSHLPEKGDMRSDGITNPRILDVYKPIFLAGLPDDLADRRVMDMRDFGEEMVLDLEVQSPNQPGYNGIACGKIRGSPDLVDSPLVLHLARGLVGYRESSKLDGMSELEDHAKYKTGHQGENDKADHPVVPADHIDRQADKQEGMEDLKAPEHKMIAQGHFLQRHPANLAFEIFGVIQHKDPENVEDTIEEPEVQVLVGVHPVFFPALPHPHPGLNIDIVIHPGHIGISMVNNIMFYIPHKTVAAEDVQGESRKMVHPFVFGKAAMRTVMHDIKT